MFLLIALYAVIGLLLFSDTNYYTDDLENFNDFPNAFIALYVLLTSENYPAIMYPAYGVSKVAHFYSMFFVSFLLVCLFFLSSLMMPFLYSQFKAHRRFEALQGRILERRALLAAFQLADYEGKSYLTYQRFSELLIKSRPDLANKPEVRMLMFSELSGDGRRLQQLEFFRFVEVVRMQYRRVFIPGLGYSFRHKLERVLADSRFERSMLWITVATTTSYAFFNAGYRDIIELVGLGTIAFFVLELMVKIGVFGVKIFLAEPSNIFDLVVIGSAAVAAVATRVVPDVLEMQHMKALPLMLISLRTLRVVHVLPAFRTIWRTALRISPFMVYAMLTMALLMFTWGVIGLDLMAGTLREPEDPPPFWDSHLSFDDFGSSQLVLFQILTTSNWHEIMYMAIYAADNRAFSVYFIAFHFVSVLIILQLVIAIYIDAFEVFNQIEQLSTDHIAEEVLQPFLSLLDHDARHEEGIGEDEVLYKVDSDHRGAASALHSLSRVGLKEYEAEEVAELAPLADVHIELPANDSSRHGTPYGSVSSRSPSIA